MCKGEFTISRTQVQFWYNRFKQGREDVNDDGCSGRSSSTTTDENIETGNKLILDNRRIIIRGVADDVDISFGACQAIFTNVLSMKRVAAKIFSKIAKF